MVKIVDGVIQQSSSEQPVPTRGLTFYAALIGFPVAVFVFGLQAGIVVAIVVGGLYLCNNPSPDVQNTLEVSRSFPLLSKNLLFR